MTGCGLETMLQESTRVNRWWEVTTPKPTRNRETFWYTYLEFSKTNEKLQPGPTAGKHFDVSGEKAISARWVLVGTDPNPRHSSSGGRCGLAADARGGGTPL